MSLICRVKVHAICSVSGDDPNECRVKVHAIVPYHEMIRMPDLGKPTNASSAV
jgi:hypothetical protein